MLSVKQVCFDDDKPRSWQQKILDWWESTWLGYRLYVLRERVSRSWAFAVYAWENYDFDAAYALQLLSFKLKRVQHVLLTKAHTVQEPKHLQALKLTIRLIDKLSADEYQYSYVRHNKKWFGVAHPPFSFEKCDDPVGGSRLISARDHLPEEQRQQENAEAVAAFAADDAAKARDKRWAFEIFAKYYENWWD